MTSPLTNEAACRIKVFVDFWNFQLTLNGAEGKVTGNSDERFKIDWNAFPPWAAVEAANVAGVANPSYEGAMIYASYNPYSSADKSLKRWLETWLNRQPGVQVDIRERQWKDHPRCPDCQKEMVVCPYCARELQTPTVEKGVDTAIATDMIRLAWEDAYDVAVIASSDRDLVPAVKFIDAKGKKIIQAGFPPSGFHLATACWASFDVFPHRNLFKRT